MDGIINVYKEKGFTSHDVVAKLRGILHQKKIGHTGTLDPDATGVLPICVGRATKVCELLTDHDKTYEAVGVLGITTDTLDTSGEVLTRRKVDVNRTELEEALSHFRGEIEQVPPMYSAVKINGKKLYEYAREGIEIERKKRNVTIYELTLLDYAGEDTKATGEDENPTFSIRVKCSKGTYIRTLIDDIGSMLGCGAAMSGLVRTAVGRFEISGALTLAKIEEKVTADATDEIVLPLESIFEEYPAYTVTEEAMKLLQNGNPLDAWALTPGSGGREMTGQPDMSADGNQKDNLIRVYGTDDEFYALYLYNKKKKQFTVEKFFHV